MGGRAAHGPAGAAPASTPTTSSSTIADAALCDCVVTNPCTIPASTRPSVAPHPEKKATRTDRSRAQSSVPARARPCPDQNALNTQRMISGNPNNHAVALTESKPAPAPRDAAGSAPPTLEAPPHASPPPPSPLPPDIADALLTAFLCSAEPLSDICARLDVTHEELLAWHDDPQTQAALDALDRIARSRAERRKSWAAPAMVEHLIRIAAIRDSTKAETARKAAAAVLRSDRKAPPPTTSPSQPPPNPSGAGPAGPQQHQPPQDPDQPPEPSCSQPAPTIAAGADLACTPGDAHANAEHHQPRRASPAGMARRHPITSGDTPSIPPRHHPAAPRAPDGPEPQAPAASVSKTRCVSGAAAIKPPGPPPGSTRSPSSAAAGSPRAAAAC